MAGSLLPDSMAGSRLLDSEAARASRVTREYIARISYLYNLDRGIYEPTARALEATLPNKTGVNERTCFYVLAFFFEPGKGVTSLQLELTRRGLTLRDAVCRKAAGIDVCSRTLVSRFNGRCSSAGSCSS